LPLLLLANGQVRSEGLISTGKACLAPTDQIAQAFAAQEQRLGLKVLVEP